MDAYDSNAGEVFVVNQGPNDVNVISDSNNSVVATIGVGSSPLGVAYDSGKGEVFVANDGSNTVSCISNASILLPGSVVATIGVGSSPNTGIGYDSGKGEVFVANDGSNNVSVISDSNNSVVATIGVGSSPLGVAYDSGKGEVFVANAGSNNVSVISDSNNSVVATIGVGSGPTGVAYDSGKGEVFVANYGSNNVSVISDSNNSVVATIGVGTNPYGIGCDFGMGEIFVTNYGSGDVSVISDSSNSLVTTITVGSKPLGVAYDSGKGEVFVADQGPNDVSVISDSNNSVVATIGVGSGPGGPSNGPTMDAYDSNAGEVFVANQGPNHVSVISDSNNSVVATIGVGSSPLGVAYDSGKGEVFVANDGSNNVSVLATFASRSTSAFTVSSSVTLLTYGGSVDAGQKLTVQGTGFGSMLPVNTLTLGSFKLHCSSATTGTCVKGALTTSFFGSIVAEVIVPFVSTSGPYVVKVADTAGNNATALITVYLDPSVATPTVSPGSVDLGQSVTFSSIASFGTGSYTYVWSGLPTGCEGTQASISCMPTNVGRFSISVEVTDSDGFSVKSGALNFTIYADPMIAIPVGSLYSGQVDGGQSVTFTTTASLGTGTYTSYTWSGLPGGCGGTTAEVTCSGSSLSPGTYLISVTVTDSNNFTSGASGVLSFVVLSDPSASAPTATSPSADIGQSVTFSASAASGGGVYAYVWKGLPTGCSSTTTDTLHCKPTGAGLFAIWVEVTDSNSYTATSGSLAFTVYSDPIVNLSADRAAFDAGQLVTLTASAELGSGGYVYVWSDLPAGCSGATATITCSPAEPGRHSVTAKITDSNGVAAVSSAVLLVVAPPLSANFSLTPSSPTSGEKVTFTSNVSGGTGALSYAWGFGDGSTGSGDVSNHTFVSAGTYKVSLWVNDSSGGSVLKALSITIVKSAATNGGLLAGYGLILVILVVVIAVAAVAALLRVRRRRTGGPSEVETTETTPNEASGDAWSDGPGDENPPEGLPEASGDDSGSEPETRTES
jgi:YVTN family beta-propeller protein